MWFTLTGLARSIHIQRASLHNKIGVFTCPHDVFHSNIPKARYPSAACADQLHPHDALGYQLILRLLPAIAFVDTMQNLCRNQQVDRIIYRSETDMLVGYCIYKGFHTKGLLQSAYVSEQGVSLRGLAQTVVPDISFQFCRCRFVWVFLLHLNSLDVCTAAFVLFMLELCPVGLVLGVGLKNRCCLRILDTIFVHIGYLVGEEQYIDSVVLIVGTHSDKQQIEYLHFLGT